MYTHTHTHTHTLSHPPKTHIYLFTHNLKCTLAFCLQIKKKTHQNISYSCGRLTINIQSSGALSYEKKERKKEAVLLLLLFFTVCLLQLC